MTDRDLIAWLKRTADGNPTHVCYIAADRIAELGDDLRIALERGDAWRDDLNADADRITELEAENERLVHELLDERVRSGNVTITTADDLRRMIAEIGEETHAKD